MNEVNRSIKIIGKIWNSYWFFPSSLFNLAICRIILVGFQLIYFVRQGYLQNLIQQADIPGIVYEPLSIVQILTFPFGGDTPPSDGILSIIFTVTFIACCFSFVGFKTNLSLAIFAIGNLFMQAYIFSFGKFHHPHALLSIAFFALALSPSGGVLSIDDLRQRLRRNIKRQRFQEFYLLEKKSTFSRWPLLLVQCLFALIYLSATVNKLNQGGSSLISLDWMNGYTLQYFLIRDGFQWGSDLGVWLGHQHTLAIILSWIAILFEGTFFLVLIFPKLVWLYVPMGAGFHTGIYLLQKAPFFQFLALYSVFLPWDWIVKQLACRWQNSDLKNKPEILYDGQCPLCIRSMTFLCYFDWFKRLKYGNVEVRWQSFVESYPHISLQDLLDEMHIILPNGTVKKGFFAFREILRYLPTLWPLLLILYFPGTAKIGPKIYKFIADRRPKFQRCSFGTCSIDPPKK